MTEPALLVPADAVLHRKLVWLTLFRMVTVTVLLGGTALVGWSEGPDAVRATEPLYGLVVATYVASAASAWALRRQRALVPIGYAQVVLDVALAGFVVALTGGAGSIFVFMYVLAIVNGGILLFRRGAFTAAAIAALADASVILVATPGPPRVVTLFVHVAALAAIATLMAYVSEQLRSADVRLAASELELEAVTALHEAIIQSVSSGLLTLDRDGRITFLNRAGEQILGRSARDVQGESAERWFGARPVAVARAEANVTNARGESLRIGYSAFALRPLAGHPGGTAVIFQDLTELRAMEEAVARSERLADLGRVAAGLAHELRNPLAAMSGAVELLGTEAALDDEQRRLMGIVLRESSRLERLVSEFLGFARPRAMERRVVDLATVCGDALDVFAHDPAATAVRVDRELRSAPIECDPEQVRQVLWNLLVNAAQAIAESGREGGGVIEVSCGPAFDGGAWLALGDDGPGISTADVQRIFLPFFTTRREGTGLGLSTVHRIVDAHGGRIDVERRSPRGTRFTVHLPPPAAASATPLRAAR